MYLVVELNQLAMKARLFLAVVTLFMASCTGVKSERVHFRSLDVETFAKFIERENIYLVDVRTPEEYAAGHIAGVDQNLDVRSATFFKDFKNLPTDKTIALYCKGGGRSKQVAGVLAGNGYKVVELSVGYDGWAKAGKPTEK